MSVGYYTPKVGWISRNKWRETKAVIAQYDELVTEYQSIIEGGSVEMDGMPKGGSISDPTAARMIRAERIREKIAAIEKSREVLDPAYADGVMEYLIHHRKFPDNASESTYRRQVRLYIHAVAVNLHII